jgi:hypothetical protein
MIMLLGKFGGWDVRSERVRVGASRETWRGRERHKFITLPLANGLYRNTLPGMESAWNCPTFTSPSSFTRCPGFTMIIPSDRVSTVGWPARAHHADAPHPPRTCCACVAEIGWYAAKRPGASSMEGEEHLTGH